MPKVKSLTLKEGKIIFLSSLGGALEFYDFIIYVFFASTLSRLFFPHANHLVSLMGVFAIFAIGYLTRPLGGIIFSHFGDKYGRKKTFIATLIFMALPSFLIGMLPTYASAGVWATFLLVIFRLLQGLSVGGEIPGALTFTGEHVNPKHRCLACSIIFFGLQAGIILGSLTSVLLITLFSSQQILSWGWRIPFVFGGLLGLISFYLRKRLTETPLFKLMVKEIQHPALPIARVLRKHLLQVVQGVMFAWLGSVAICLLYLYMPTYLASILHYQKNIINQLNTLNILLLSIISIGAGWLADRIGRRVLLTVGALGFIILGYAMFYLLAQHEWVFVISVMIAFSIFASCIIGVYPCTLIELFPTQVRYTGMAISYNLAFAIFGGMAPLFATYLISATGNILSPSFYLIGSAIACLVGTLFLKSKHGKSLAEI